MNILTRKYKLRCSSEFPTSFLTFPHPREVLRMESSTMQVKDVCGTNKNYKSLYLTNISKSGNPNNKK